MIFSTIAFKCLSQEKGKTRFGLETGVLVPNEGGLGLSAALESKYNIRNNISFGLRVETLSYFKHKSYSANISSLSVTYDYYFNRDNKLISPFIGVGIGYFICEAMDFSANTVEEEYSRYNNPSCFLRLGTEFGKFRISIAYSLYRKSNEANVYNKNNDNVSLLLGFYIGGGKWRK